MRWPFVWRRRYKLERAHRIEAERQRDIAMDTLAELKNRMAAWERHTIVGRHLGGQGILCPDCGQLRQPIGEHYCAPRKE